MGTVLGISAIPTMTGMGFSTPLTAALRSQIHYVKIPMVTESVTRAISTMMPTALLTMRTPVRRIPHLPLETWMETAGGCGP